MAIATVGVALMASPAQSIQPPVEPSTNAIVSVAGASRSLDAAQPSLQWDLRNQPASAQRLETFKRTAGGRWEARWDARGDRPNVVQGSGIALLPGKGNALRPGAFGVAAASELSLATVADAARGFLDTQRDLLRLDGVELTLDAERSGGYGAGRPFWSVEFGQFKNGVRVDGAFVYVRVSHGNVVQFGAERVGEVRIDTVPASTREEAFQAAWKELALPAGAALQSLDEPGELRIVALPADDTASGVAFDGAWGEGYRHLLVWRYRFRLAGDDGNYEMRVDAQTRRVLDLRDLTLNVEASVTGGVYPTTNTEPEVIMPLPFATVRMDGTASITDTLGIYDYAGGTATVALDGQYIRIVDNCGAISLSNSTGGDLAFGSGSGTDCATPPGNTAGPGNTHSARTGFYHLSRINEKARGILPDNEWLQGRLTANMNVNNVCNAAYSPFDDSVNFYRSGQGCANTGEIAAVFLHEWGHGLDTHTGGTADEMASGEAVGDTFAFLETGQSCIGPGFDVAGGVCHGCTTCTGVRDVGDFSSSGTRTIASPANVTAAAGIDCGALIGRTGVACPYINSRGFAYQGPMGYEGHCESQIAGSANWDLRAALIEHFGEDGSARMDDIWYGSLQASKGAYQVQDGGQCNPRATVNGCGATNWYTVYLAADDDDGDLANGTPNACRIWDALNAHGIACGERPACSADDVHLMVPNDRQEICASADARFTIDVVPQRGFSGPVTLDATQVPAGASVGFSPNPVTAGSTAVMTVAGTGNLGAGEHEFGFKASAEGSLGATAAAHLTLRTGTPAVVVLASPADGAGNVTSSGVTLEWRAVEQAASYLLEVAADPFFQEIIASRGGLTTTNWRIDDLTPNTRYYWRVRAENICGAGATSAVSSFTTDNMVCISPSASIGASLSSTLRIADQAMLRGVRVRVDATPNIAESASTLKFSITHAGTTVKLFDKSNCTVPAIDVTFEDAGSAPTDCPSLQPLTGTLVSAQPLDPAFAGLPAEGDWVLSVTDRIGDRRPSRLNTWCVDLDLQERDHIFVDGFDERS